MIFAVSFLLMVSSSARKDRTSCMRDSGSASRRGNVCSTLGRSSSERPTSDHKNRTWVVTTHHDGSDK